MEWINPPEISGRIMSVLDNADEWFVFVSPYVYATSWEKLHPHLKRAIARDVRIEFYVREEKHAQEVRELGLTPRLVPNLHAKLYMSESEAVVSSMNLSYWADIRSIDLGYWTEKVDEMVVLREFLDRYVREAARPEAINKPTLTPPSAWAELVQKVGAHLAANYPQNKFEFDPGRFNCQGFCHPRLWLGVEGRSSYFRIELRLEHPYKDAVRCFGRLRAISTRIEEEVGVLINWGGQMRRLKLDLDSLAGVKFANLGPRHADALFELIDRFGKVVARHLQESEQA